MKEFREKWNMLNIVYKIYFISVALVGIKLLFDSALIYLLLSAAILVFVVLITDIKK